MKLKSHLFVSVIFLIVLLVSLVCLAGCRNPQKENDKYLKEIEPLLQQTEREMEKAREIMKSEMITKYDQEVGELSSDITDAKSRIESAKEVLAKNRKKFEKEDVPEEAKKVSDKVSEYFKVSEKYLKDIEEITKYFEKTLPIVDKNQKSFEDAEGRAETTETYAQEVPIRVEYKKNLVETVDTLKKIKPPKSLKDIHNLLISSYQLELTYVDKIISAASREAEKEYFDTIDELNRKLGEIDTQAQNLYKVLAEKSDEAKIVSDLKKLYVEIEDDIQELKKKLKI